MTESTKESLARWIFPLCGVFCLWPEVPSAAALVLGIFLALTLENPYLSRTKKLTKSLLAWSVMGLGAGMNLLVVARVGMSGIVYTMSGIALTLLLGLGLGRIFKVDRIISILTSVGTAICGGSAIAAAAPVLHAKSEEVSVSLGIVFMLNALALFLFPWIGHALHMEQVPFGLWSALAIHDTSSVVGATLQYGPQALEVGTTVKLARALWIVPVTLGLGWWQSRSHKTTQQNVAKPAPPWFIGGFLLAAAVVTFIPSLQPAGHVIELIARRTLVLTLFLIGANLTRATLKSVGLSPLLQGVCLWLLTASVSLAAVHAGLVK